MIIFCTQPTVMFPYVSTALSSRYQNYSEFTKTFVYENEEDIKKTFDLKLNYHKRSEEIPLNIREFIDYQNEGYFLSKNFNVGNNYLNIYNKQKYKFDSRYKFDLVYGVFDPLAIPKHLFLNNTNFIFSLVDHPLNQIYTVYYYFAFATSRDFNKYSGAKNDSYWSLYHSLTQQYPTLEKFIDTFIEKRKIEFLYDNIKMALTDHYFSFKNYKNFTYIGKIDTEENTLKSLKYISNELKLNLLDNFEWKSLSGWLHKSKSEYRKDELKIILKDEIEFFNNLNYE